MHKFINRISFFLLNKGSSFRLGSLCVFIIVMSVLLNIFEPLEYIPIQRDKNDLAQLQNDIYTLMNKYEIKNLCQRVICTKSDRDKIKSINGYNSAGYIIFAKCNGISCYEFVREIENIAPIFIKEVISSNIEMIDNDSLEWIEDILINFEI